MAEKQSGMTPSRQEQRPVRRGSLWGGGPQGAFQRFADEMDRMFEDFGFGRRGSLVPLWQGTGGQLWAPDVDVFQKNDQLTIRADLPGMSKDEVSVEVTDNVVVIQGERKREHEEEREGFYRSERSYGSFSRAIPLPDGAITEEAKATFRDGVLEITMPAPPASKGRRLEIGEGSSSRK
jgi:HSP20 family protein